MSGQGQSNVGFSSVYEAGNQRNYTNAEINEAERYKEGKTNSHLAQDSKDQRTISNKLAREEKRSHEPDEKDLQAELAKKDPTAPAILHGNKPSRGAEIDKELQEEEEEILKNKGSYGPKV